MKSKLKLGILGTGRIGRLHVENILIHFNNYAEIKVIYDPLLQEDNSWAKLLGILEKYTNDLNVVFTDKDIDAVIICSTTDTHVEYIERALEFNKHIFCEKPISQNLEKLEYINKKILEKPSLKFQVGFNRRFDKNIQCIKEKILKNNEIYLISLISNDPELPSIEYLKNSGGLLLDMAIHDFDLIQYLVNDDICSVFSMGSVLISSNLKKIKDIDTCITQVKFSKGILANIINCRQSPIGYDQRIEVLTKQYNFKSENIRDSQVITENKQGSVFSSPKNNFIERYQDSYVNELQSFFTSIISNTSTVVGCSDIIKAVKVAKAAMISLEKNIPISPERVEK